MKEMIIVDGRKYFHRDDRTGAREKITAKQADRIFRGWMDAGLQVHRHYGRFTHVWVDLDEPDPEEPDPEEEETRDFGEEGYGDLPYISHADAIRGSYVMAAAAVKDSTGQAWCIVHTARTDGRSDLVTWRYTETW